MFFFPGGSDLPVVLMSILTETNSLLVKFSSPSKIIPVMVLFGFVDATYTSGEPVEFTLSFISVFVWDPAGMFIPYAVAPDVVILLLETMFVSDPKCIP